MSRLAPLFAETIKLIKQRQPDATFIMPAANAARREQIEHILSETQAEAVVVDGQSRTVMAAADAILLASGTAALEAMLVKRPMVVAYKVNRLTYAIMKRMIKVPYVSLPNLLANETLVPELLQDEAQPENLATRLLQTWQSFQQDKNIQQKYVDLHKMLRKNAGEQGAQAIVTMLAEKQEVPAEKQA